jgi:hypothetical protein
MRRSRVAVVAAHLVIVPLPGIGDRQGFVASLIFDATFGRSSRRHREKIPDAVVHTRVRISATAASGTR